MNSGITILDTNQLELESRTARPGQYDPPQASAAR